MKSSQVSEVKILHLVNNLHQKKCFKELTNFNFQEYQESLPEASKHQLEETVKFLEFSAGLLDFFHSSVPFVKTDDQRFEILDSAMRYLDEWIAQAKSAPGTPSERSKMILADKTLFDFKSMILGFKQICIQSNNRHSSTSLLAWKINTNHVENIFCQQRGYLGQNDNPRYDQYAHTMNSILLGQQTTTFKNNAGNIDSLPFYKPAKLKRCK